jgi:hypothetical protein
MRVKAKLMDVNREIQMVTFGTDRRETICVYRSYEGMVTVSDGGRKVTTEPNERLEGIHASAVAFVAMTGSVEGFPEQEFDL